MKKLSIYILSVLIISVGISWLFFSFAYVKKNRTDLTNFNHILKEHDQFDVAVFGSSRAATFVNPRIIDSITGLNSFNFGANGVGILETRMMILKFIQLHPKPQLIILNIDHNNFYSKGFLYNCVDYYSFLKDSMIYSALAPYNKNYGSFFVRKLNQLLELFASTDDDRYHFLTNQPKTEIKDTFKYETFKGFSSPLIHWSAASENALKDKTNASSDEQGFSLLSELIKECKNDSIKIVIVHAPILYLKKEQIFNYDEIMNHIKKIASEYNTPYWEYDTMKICESKFYFRDFSHVNLLGANIYSAQLAKDIKSFLLLPDSLKTESEIH